MPTGIIFPLLLAMEMSPEPSSMSSSERFFDKSPFQWARTNNFFPFKRLSMLWSGFLALNCKNPTQEQFEILHDPTISEKERYLRVVWCMCMCVLSPKRDFVALGPCQQAFTQFHFWRKGKVVHGVLRAAPITSPLLHSGILRMFFFWGTMDISFSTESGDWVWFISDEFFMKDINCVKLGANLGHCQATSKPGNAICSRFKC